MSFRTNFFEKDMARAFLLENNRAEVSKYDKLLEADMTSVNNNLVAKLYKSAIDKSFIDFEDIPASKGDITKYSGYQDMMQALDVVDRLARKSNVKIPEVDVVLKAAGNVVALKDIYTKGYALDNNFIMLQYCTIVATCVEATAGIISSYVDFVKQVDSIKFTIVQPKTSVAAISIENLNMFNSSVASGEYSKICNIILKNGNTGIIKESAIIVTAAVITSIVALVALMRHIVFRFYYNRMKLSDYLRMQAMFLEMNKTNIQAKESKLSPEKKKQVLKKQQDLANSLNKMADKLKVESSMANTKAATEMKKENTTYTLDTLKSNDTIDRVELL